MTIYFITEHHNPGKGLSEWSEMPLKATICINLLMADYKYGEFFLDGIYYLLTSTMSHDISFSPFSFSSTHNFPAKLLIAHDHGGRWIEENI